MRQRSLRRLGTVILATSGVATACGTLATNETAVLGSTPDGGSPAGGATGAGGSGQGGTEETGGGSNSGGTFATGGIFATGGVGPGGTPSTGGAPSDYQPEPITLNGAFWSKSGMSNFGENLKVALVWYPHQDNSGGVDNLECPAGYAPSVPYPKQVVTHQTDIDANASPFQLSVPTKPPPEALQFDVFPRSGGYGMGQLVLYRDVNQNGTLDRGTVYAPSPDQVRGASSTWIGPFDSMPDSTSYVVFYADADVLEVGPPVFQGYNLFRDQTDNAATDARRTAVPLDTTIDIEIDATPRLTTLNCEYLCVAPMTFQCPATPAGLPPGGQRKCFPPGEQSAGTFSWQDPECDGCSCVWRACSFYLTRGEPVPDDWPCEIPDR